MIHLDTSFLIRAMRRGSREDARLRGWLRRGEPLGVSAIAWAEFLCGPVALAELQLAERIVPRRVPFTDKDGLSLRTCSTRPAGAAARSPTA